MGEVNTAEPLKKGYENESLPDGPYCDPQAWR